jgi:hypothetical protein
MRTESIFSIYGLTLYVKKILHKICLPQTNGVKITHATQKRKKENNAKVKVWKAPKKT